MYQTVFALSTEGRVFLCRNNSCQPVPSTSSPKILVLWESLLLSSCALLKSPKKRLAFLYLIFKKKELAIVTCIMVAVITGWSSVSWLRWLQSLLTNEVWWPPPHCHLWCDLSQFNPIGYSAWVSYLLAIEIGVSSERSTRTGEREHGQRYWDWNVDTHLNQRKAAILITRSSRLQSSLRKPLHFVSLNLRLGTVGWVVSD